ncbi:MAG: hypothetical protein ISQ70_04885 [Pirellulales bacterium]|nr:hypothetical protein [Pirellulales bacterium]MBL7194285.1 hypothetical protein [Pirellulales bacterium]
MTSRDHGPSFAAAVRAILSSTAFFTFVCFAAAMALLLAEPDKRGSETVAAGTTADAKTSDADRIAEAESVTREQQPQAGYGD